MDLASGLATATHSFAPSTKVLMADGTTKAIADIKLGDRVVATDPIDKQTTAQPVTAVHANLDQDLVDVTLSAASPATNVHSSGEGKGDRSTRGPTATLHTTAQHPFWDATSNSWIHAVELKPQASTLVGPEGQLQSVASVTSVAGFKSMRDLTVANVHTYYIVAGRTPVLVHNCGPDGTIDPHKIRFSQDSISNNYSDRPDTVLGTVEGLLSRDINPMVIPPIRILQHEGKWFTLDNRRLAAFQMADTEIPFVIVSKSDPAIAATWKKHSSTETDGFGIRIDKIPGVGSIWWNGTR
jgi:hypothetical protein